MALELENLVFSVSTGQLDDARIKLAKLGDAVNALNKPMQDIARSSAKTNEVIAKSELAAEKARQAQKNLATETENSSEVVKKQTSVLERQQMILEFMTQGYSKGQSSQLAYAKAAGAITTEIEQLGKVLQTQRTLMGTDPFDKSIGAMQALKNEYTVIKEVQRLYNAELGLSRTQMEDLAKEKIRLIEKYKLEGKTLSDIKEGIIDLNQQYIRNANAENSIISAMKDKQDILKSQAAAEAYLAKETERVNRLIESKGEITSSTNNRLIKYEQALKASGVSSEVAAAKLAKYKEQLLETQKVAGNRQMDYLSRALGPQITDIFVGLATGQNPMTVLLQQGGQLRDQFALAGVEGANMGKALTTAFTNMYDSTKNVAIAVGTMLVDGFIKLGLAATTVVSKMTGDFYIVGKSTEFLIKNLSGLITLFPALETAIIGLGEAINFSIGAGVIALFAGLAIAFKQIVNEEGELSRALLTTGAALGFSKQSAIEFAQSLDGVSESKVKNFLTELAKNSVENTGNLKELTKTAVDLEKYAGISLDETAKKYAELQKKPVDGLVKLATETGRVSVATLKHAEDLKEAKKYTELATLANEEFARSYKEVAAATEKDLSPIERIFKTISDEASSGWNAFKEWANTPEVLEVVKTAWTAFSVVLKTVVASVKQVITGIGSVISAIKNLAGLNFSAALDSVVSGYENVQKIGAEYTADVKNTLGGNYYGASNAAAGGMSTEQLAANARAAKAFEQQKKDREEARKKAESEAKKLLEQQKKDMDVYNDLMNKAEGQNKAYNNSLESLNRLRKEGKITQEQYNDAFGYLVRSQPGHVKQMQELTQAAEEYDKAVKDVAKTVKEWSDSADVEAEKLNLRQKLLGLSAEEQARVNAEYDKYSKLKKLDLDLENALNAAKSKFTTEDFEQVQKPKIIAANAKLRENVERESSIKIAEQQIEEFNKTRDAISGAIADALFEGGKKGADSLKNYLKTTFRKFVIDVFINPIVGSIMSSLGVQGGLSGTAGSFLGNAGGSLLSSTIGSISGVASAFGTAFSNAALSTVQGWVGMSGTAAQMGTSLANAGYWGGSAAGTTASGIGASIGAYAPYVLAAVAAVKLLESSKGETRSGATYITGSNGLVQYQQGPSGGEIAGQTSRDLFNATKTSIENTLKLVGSSATLSGFTAGLESSANGKGFAFAGGFVDGQGFGASLGREGYTAGQWSYRSMTSEEAFKSYVTELSKVTLQALQAAKDVPLLIKNQLQNVDFQSITESDISSLTNSVNATIESIQKFSIAMNSTAIKSVVEFDFKKAADLAGAFNSVDTAVESMQFFYENFYSEQERMTALNESLNTSFENLGVSMPKTTQEFRDLMIGALGSGNNSLAAALANLQGTFIELADASKETVDNIQQEINRLRGENLTDSIVQGTALRAEFDIMSALARGGDITALTKLPEFSQAIEKNMTDFASSASDVIFARAMLAQSLSDTMSSLGGNTTVVPSAVGVAGAVGSVSTVSSVSTAAGTSLSAAASSQSDLISMLVAEIQGLRAEVRAGVSANTKTSKILERANQDGETISISGSLDGGVI